jgi:hypothetical protein
MKTESRGTTVEHAFLKRVCSRFIHLNTPISPIGTRVPITLALPAIPGIIRLHCTKHITGNARDYVPTAQKSFRDNMVWALQESKSVGEYYVHLAKFNANYPNVKVHYIFLISVLFRVRKAYLEQIPKEDWVHYAQVGRGVHTYGWRTSNMAEIGMAFAKKMR